jgi:acetyltransferase-like isoleucine patch superfamily enzyme
MSIDRHAVPDEKIHTAPVYIGKNVWLSASVVILHGVTIGDNSIIGACSLVRENVPPNCFYAGNPLKFIRKLL